jgi:hypothetical protein
MNTETKHTQEPWVITERHVPVTLNDFPDKQVLFTSIEAVGFEAGGGIALVHIKPGHGNPNARRIVACVNLLAGFSTEDIESGKVKVQS